MNVLVLNHADLGRTSGVLAVNLCEALKNGGFNVEVITNVPNTHQSKSIKIHSLQSNQKFWYDRNLKRIKNRIRTFTRALGKIPATDPKHAVLDFDLTKPNNITKQITETVSQKPDVIVVLFMQKFLTFKNLRELHELYGVKIVLYLMDMAPLTGGCHYAWNCKGFHSNCGNCPAYYSKKEHDQSRVNWMFNQSHKSKMEIELISGTQWLTSQARSSRLFSDTKIHTILVPVDSKQFMPRDKAEVRDGLGLPVDKRIVFFGANAVASPRKGFKHLNNALHLVKKQLTASEIESIHLVVAGTVPNNLKLPFANTLFGHVDILSLAKLFSASDVFVSPSVEDSGPMMVNQAIMSGTPVVAFQMGVAEDLIENGQTGFRVELANDEALSEAIKKILLLPDEQLAQMSKNCRKMALERFSIETFESRIVEILN